MFELAFISHLAPTDPHFGQPSVENSSEKIPLKRGTDKRDDDFGHLIGN